MIAAKPMKPAQFAEHQLLTAILDGEFPPGSILPGERKLSEQIGVTRPTLRETLQKMAREGWLNIRHGKPTEVRDYLREGGMGVLSTMARFGEELPKSFVEHFLKLRCIVLPPVAKMAMENSAEVLKSYLETSGKLDGNAQAFTEYDWNLQLLMASESGNPFIRIILNDFDFMFKKLGVEYFQFKEARDVSMLYYNDLLAKIQKNDGKGVEERVAEVMDMALELWKGLSE